MKSSVIWIWILDARKSGEKRFWMVENLPSRVWQACVSWKMVTTMIDDGDDDGDDN